MKCGKKDCIYRGRISGTNWERTDGFCDYLGRMGRPRECPAERCDKYVKGNSRRTKDNAVFEKEAEW